jgi:hypothetical protein
MIYYLRQRVELDKVWAMCYTLIRELPESIRELTFGSNVSSIELGQIVDSIL